MPSLWGRQQKQTELIANLDIVFEAVSQEHRLPRGDLPDPVVYRSIFVLFVAEAPCPAC